MLGAPKGALIGRRMLDAFPEGEGSQIHLAFERARQDLTPVEFESLYRPRDRWFEIRGFPSADGTTTIYFRDITKRKRAQEALSLQARMLDTVGQAVIGIGRDDSIFYWNRAAADLFGWQSDEVQGKQAATFTGEMSPGESMLSKRDGSIFPALVVDTELRDDQGAAVGIVRVVSDLSERLAGQESQRFLANAGSDLASTLDFESLIAAVALLAVPTLGDCCIVDVIEEEGASRRVESVWAEAIPPQVERRFSRRLYDTAPRSTSLLSVGEATAIVQITDDAFRTVAVDVDELKRLRASSLKSMMVAPLKTGGRMLGTIAVGSTQRSYGGTDADCSRNSRAASRLRRTMRFSTKRRVWPTRRSPTFWR